MNELLKKIHNAETGKIDEFVISDNELSEIASIEEAKAAKLEAINATKMALLEKLGITEDEAKLLLS